MELLTWLTYLVIITAVIAFPGPFSLLVSLHGYQYGPRKAQYTIFGNLFGSWILMCLSAMGLGVLLAFSETMFSVVRYLGAGYLVCLGCLTLKRDFKPDPPSTSMDPLACSPFALLRQGFFAGIGHSWTWVFFVALFPIFLDPAAALPGQLLTMMGTWLVVDYLVKQLYLQLGRSVSHQFEDTRLVRLVNRLTGGLFVTFGSVLSGGSRS